MYHVNTQYVDERMINVYYYYYHVMHILVSVVCAERDWHVSTSCPLCGTVSWLY